MNELAYPLQWPLGRSRTKNPISGAFGTTHKTQDGIQKELLKEIRLMSGTSPVISTNIPIRNDGLPYTRFREPDDQGVAVYLSRGKERVCFACDQYDKVYKNMRAITKTIEAMRGIERWGSKEMLDRAFTGFAALPPPEAAIEMPGPGALPRPWFEVLGVFADAPWSTIRSVYRDLMREASDTEKLAINLAYEAAKRSQNLV